MPLPAHRGYHVIYDESLLDALDYASNHGWTCIVPDFGVPRYGPDYISSEERNQLREMSNNLGIRWSFHAPGDDVSLFISYPSIRQSILEFFRRIIDLVREISHTRTNLVVHAGGPPQYRIAGEKQDAFLNQNLDVYENAFFGAVVELIEYGSPDVAITLENHAWTPLVRHAIPSLIARGMRLCLDIPKLYTKEMQLLHSDWMIFQQYSDAIDVVHIHDMMEGLGTHQIIGAGMLDFRPPLEFLSKIERPLQYIIEVRPREAATESLIGFEALLSKLDISLL